MAGTDFEGGLSAAAALATEDARSTSPETAGSAEEDAHSPTSLASADEAESERSAATADRSASPESGSSDNEQSDAPDSEKDSSEEGTPASPTPSPASSSDSSSGASSSPSSSAALPGGFCLWELCCAPDSELVAAVLKGGDQAERLTLETGYDLQSHSAMQQAKDRITKSDKWCAFPRAWASPPCTKWSSMQNLTKRNLKQKLALKRARLESRRLVSNCVEVLLEVLLRLGGHFYYEWPHSCQGWQIPELRHLRKQTQKSGQQIFEVVFEGCAFGLQDSSGDFFLRKKWRVLTNDPKLQNVARRCPFQGRDATGHQHKTIQGPETARSAFYPPQMCCALARHWRRYGAH